MNKTHLPGSGIGGDQSLSHDGFENFGQHALAVLVRRGTTQNVLGHGRVADHQKGLGAKGQVEDWPTLQKVLVEEQKERTSRQRLEVTAQTALDEGKEGSLVLLDGGCGDGGHSKGGTKSHKAQDVDGKQNRHVQSVGGGWTLGHILETLLADQKLKGRGLLDQLA